MTMTDPVILNTRTGEFFPADEAVYVTFGDIPLDLDYIRESGQNVQSFGDSVSLGGPDVYKVLEVELDALLLRWGKQAKDASAIRGDFHDGVATGYRGAIRDLRAALARGKPA